MKTKRRRKKPTRTPLIVDPIRIVNIDDLSDDELRHGGWTPGFIARNPELKHVSIIITTKR